MCTAGQHTTVLQLTRGNSGAPEYLKHKQGRHEVVTPDGKTVADIERCTLRPTNTTYALLHLDLTDEVLSEYAHERCLRPTYVISNGRRLLSTARYQVNVLPQFASTGRGIGSIPAVHCYLSADFFCHSRPAQYQRNRNTHNF